MKTIKIVILVGLFAGLLSCDKNDTEEINNLDVGTYIELYFQSRTTHTPTFQVNVNDRLPKTGKV